MIPHPPVLTNGTCQSSAESGRGDVSRTVSRSPSDVSMNSGKATEAAVAADKMKHDNVKKLDSHVDTKVKGIATTDEIVDGGLYTTKKQKISHKTRNNGKPLMSTEKAAVAAMLAMKTSSDESDGDSISAVTNKSVARSTTQHKTQSPESAQQQQHHHALKSPPSLVASV